ncbi:hypothetical protein V3C99_013239 [Haemonchus contortus]
MIRRAFGDCQNGAT